ncbi:hypothetical protein G1K66_12015 [Tenacibaculum finnmarkense]|uniref:hypothetical protein n=1 Tax=Tenacibaculum finnmarkense TaxID=2781243 RepID=UPI001EFAA206|nr:hypothetical protein [Tenacibaculum finnmarkense]MCG8813980.1 hypothetical protein [Tenacibaculum finnmarkense]
MNIAVSSIVIFLLLLPGIVFRRFYFTEEFSKQYFKQNFFELFVSSIIPSVFIHFFLSFGSAIIGNHIDLEILGQLLTYRGYPEEAFKNIQNNINKIATYYIISLIIGIICGYFSKKIIRNFNFDSRKKIFRFKNSWHYIFSGEFFNFPRASFDLIEDSFDIIDFIYIDALVESSEGTIIYDGILVDYELSNNGGLDNITLKNVQRRMMKDDAEKKYYEIPGHIMVIPFETVINLNFSYYKLTEIEGNDNAVEIIPELVK